MTDLPGTGEQRELDSLFGVDQALYGALWSYGLLLRATSDYLEIEGREGNHAALQALRVDVHATRS